MGSEESAQARRRRYERLKTRLLALGPVLQGSILPRMIVRKDPDAPAGRRLYGPYYQWTRKIGGRTINVNLTAAQAKTFGRAIVQHRRMEAILDQMRALSLKTLKISTPGVKKRKPRKSNGAALS